MGGGRSRRSSGHFEDGVDVFGVGHLTHAVNGSGRGLVLVLMGGRRVRAGFLGGGGRSLPRPPRRGLDGGQIAVKVRWTMSRGTVEAHVVFIIVVVLIRSADGNGYGPLVLRSARKGKEFPVRFEFDGSQTRRGKVLLKRPFHDDGVATATTSDDARGEDSVADAAGTVLAKGNGIAVLDGRFVAVESADRHGETFPQQRPRSR